MHATKGRYSFETINTPNGYMYAARNNDTVLPIEVVISAYIEQGKTFYLASLYTCGKPQMHVDASTAKLALHYLAKQASVTMWNDEHFFNNKLFPLFKDFNAWMKRPPRETFNNRH